jgi:hypothetical protein
MNLIEALSTSPLGEFVRTSPWLYPIALSLHLLAMALLVGTGLVLDVRLAGWTRTPLRPLLSWLTPAQMLAGAVAVLSGSVLFLGDAVHLAANPAFQIKIVLLAVLLGNALGFTFGARRNLAGWEHARRPPAAARISGLVALVAWPAVVVAGRLIAFT